MPARRVLVPLVVLALAAALYLWPRGTTPIVDVPDDVNACATNLRAIYAGLLEAHARAGRVPSGSGIAFFAALIAEGVWEDTPAKRALLTCPGPHAAPVPAGLDFRASSALPPSASAYAGRDTSRFPLTKFPSGGAELEPLIACDNAGGLNHEGCMNVLFSDGSVITLLLAQEIERGIVPPGTTNLPVGPDSPVPELRELLGD